MGFGRSIGTSATDSSMSVRHGIARNIGAALGLFAMLVVTLLAPLHQAHAANRDLAQANGELAAAVICHGDGVSQADAPADADRNDVTAKCPICSLAKQVGAVSVPVAAGMPAVWNVAPARDAFAEAGPLAAPERAAQPRAPPVLV
jgi:hypothetical protein